MAISRRPEDAAPPASPAPVLDFAQILDVLADAVTIRDRADRIVYANRAALQDMGFASLADLQRRPPREIMADYLVLDELGRELSMADVPSVRIMRGEPADPLLMRTVHRASGALSWKLLKATPLRDDDGRARRDRDDHRGRHRVQVRRAAQPLPRRGGRDARLLAGLRADAAERGLVGGAAARRLVRGRPRRRGRPARARRRRALRSRAAGARRAPARVRAARVRPPAGGSAACCRAAARRCTTRSPTRCSCARHATTSTSRCCARSPCARC